MNLLYLLGSLGGVALLVALCAALFGTKGMRLTTAQNLEAYLAQILPAFRTRNIALDKDAKSALAENDIDGTIHLIVACGDGFVARKLSRPLLKTVTRQDATLCLRLSDITLPRADIAFADLDAAAQWENKLWAL